MNDPIAKMKLNYNTVCDYNTSLDKEVKTLKTANSKL